MFKIDIDIMEIVIALSSLIDLVSPQLNKHHARVAYIARSIGEGAGMDVKTIENIRVAALLHDCGALSLTERLAAMKFDSKFDKGHPEVGYRLLKSLNYFDEVAEIIRHHHVWWMDAKVGSIHFELIPEESYVICLADRIDVLIHRDIDILGQADGIRERIRQGSGRLFKPKLVEVFLKLSEKDEFWKGISKTHSINNGIGRFSKWTLGTQEIIEIVSTFEKIIDFRSRFTATHSRGVAVVSEEISKRIGMEEREIFRIRLAGSLHDIGKLGVPLELVEKTGKLTDDEYVKIKHHALLTYEVLRKMECLEFVYEAAAYHHELLDGTGYPFGLIADELSMGSRIVAVADMFTAMTEDRPYRKGMDSRESLKILQGLADKGKLDAKIIHVLEKDLRTIQKIQYNGQKLAASEYKKFFYGISTF